MFLQFGGKLKTKHMSVSILEALQNASLNLDNVKYLGPAILPLAKEQLDNAIVLLEKGYDIDDQVEPLLEKYGSVEAVPAKSSVDSTK